jgi:hypothetical protein
MHTHTHNIHTYTHTSNDRITSTSGGGKNIGNRKLPITNLRKDFIEIRKMLLIQYWHLWFWGKFFLKINLFFAVFHFMFGNDSEFPNHMNKF